MVASWLLSLAYVELEEYTTINYPIEEITGLYGKISQFLSMTQLISS